MATRKYLSLRNLFLRWMLLFTILPLLLIVVFFVQQFKTTVQKEMFERLIVYTKQVQDLFNEYENYSKARLTSVAEDKSILYQLKTSSVEGLTESFNKVIEQEIPTSYVVYNQEGQVVLRIGSRENANRGPPFLGEKAKKELLQQDQFTYANYYLHGQSVILNLSVVRRIKDDTLKWEGFLEKVIVVDEEILQQIKTSLGLDVIFFGPKGDVFLTSLPEEKFTREQLSKDFLRGNNHFFDVAVRGQNFGFISTAVDWGGQKFLIAIGASKETLTRGLSRIMYMLLVSLFILLGCLLIFGYFFTNQVIQPISRLVDAISRMKDAETPVQIENSSRTEIGVLTDSFNAMSQTIYDYGKDLEHKISDLEKANEEVQSTQTQLLQSAKLASLGQLVAGVAHELNNPIGFVYSNMQHLREYVNSLMTMVNEMGKKYEAFDKLQKKYDYEFIAKDLPKLIASCEEGARRTRDIVIGLRNFSRSSDKDQKKFSITDCIDSTLDLLKGTVKKDQITVEKVYADYIPPMEGNPNQISQVFMNVISNAYQAMPDQGKISIEVTYNERDSEIHVGISDTGAGIPPEYMDKIFDPFFTTKEVGQGTGLGLSISYGIVKSHGGDILVQSEAGRGTTFNIKLPVPK